MTSDGPSRRLPSLLTGLLALTMLLAGCVDDDGTGGDGTGGNDDGGGEDPNYGLQETWYLHETGPCDNSGTPQEYFIDKTDSSDDADGCGSVGFGAAGFTYTYPGEETSHGHDSGAAVAVELYLQFAQPGPVTIDWVLRGGGSELASGTMEAMSLSQTSWTQFTDETTTSQAIDSGDTLTFEFTFPAAAGANYHGYEGDHTSLFTIG